MESYFFYSFEFMNQKLKAEVAFFFDLILNCFSNFFDDIKFDVAAYFPNGLYIFCEQFRCCEFIDRLLSLHLYFRYWF